ncbi:hypothetical protein FA13DRAFT_1091017 [Coprinellus micaceus]|uniref:Uncharacterized protein n=1 Tax=Coprinellus micaceus TaxID=71717 RepID=A0A4Y7TSI2_COPMI|nr:hypothetical protein FA13DRAFT_1091017 [Coprinellus micaceus]
MQPGRYKKASGGQSLPKRDFMPFQGHGFGVLGGRAAGEVKSSPNVSNSGAYGMGLGLQSQQAKIQYVFPCSDHNAESSRDSRMTERAQRPAPAFTHILYSSPETLTIVLNWHRLPRASTSPRTRVPSPNLNVTPLDTRSFMHTTAQGPIGRSTASRGRVGKEERETRDEGRRAVKRELTISSNRRRSVL